MRQLPTLVFWPRGGSESKYMCLLSHFLVLKVSPWSLYPWFRSNHYYSLGNICGRIVSSLGLALWQDGSVQDTLDEFFLDTFHFSSFPDYASYIPWLCLVYSLTINRIISVLDPEPAFQHTSVIQIFWFSHVRTPSCLWTFLWTSHQSLI